MMNLIDLIDVAIARAKKLAVRARAAVAAARANKFDETEVRAKLEELNTAMSAIDVELPLIGDPATVPTGDSPADPGAATA